MKDVNWLRENYFEYLRVKEENYKKSIVNLQKQECNDEANMQRIKLNIVEIFHKMFNISLNNDPKLLREKYLSFFDKITEPWIINKGKALTFGNEKEVIIEDLKIQESEELKIKFKDYYSQLEVKE